MQRYRNKRGYIAEILIDGDIVHYRWHDPALSQDEPRFGVTHGITCVTRTHFVDNYRPIHSNKA